MITTLAATMTRDDLAARLREQRGTTFATITARTDARCRKTGNPFGQVFKVSRVNVAIGHDYESSVNRQRAREGGPADFQAQTRQWGERLEGAPLVEHRGRFYLACKVERSIMHRYEDADGRLLDPEAVRPFLPAKQAGAQGLERAVVERTYALDAILSIAIDGAVYEITD